MERSGVKTGSGRRIDSLSSAWWESTNLHEFALIVPPASAPFCPQISRIYTDCSPRRSGGTESLEAMRDLEHLCEMPYLGLFLNRELRKFFLDGYQVLYYIALL